MFQGETAITLDDKGRMALPTAYREAVAKACAKRVHRDMQLKIVGAAATVELDGNARVLVPASQRNAAGIDKKAVLLGMNNKFELWSEQAHLNKIRQSIAEHELSEEMLGLKL